MQGIHYWIKNPNPTLLSDKCMVENSEFYYTRNIGRKWDFVVNEEGFGFTTKSGAEFIYVPTGILPGLISVTRPNDESYRSFWVREGAFDNPKVRLLLFISFFFCQFSLFFCDFLCLTVFFVFQKKNKLFI